MKDYIPKVGKNLPENLVGDRDVIVAKIHEHEDWYDLEVIDRDNDESGYFRVSK